MPEVEFKKPTISKFEERCKRVFYWLQVRDYVTKPQIAEFLGWQYPKTDRQIRDIISSISQKHPIVSTSDTNKGFKLAKDPSDIELVKHSFNELNSRIDEMNKRKRPLMNFLNNNNSTLTLFD